MPMPDLNQPIFTSSQHALNWATEVLRFKELTRGSRWQREVSEDADTRLNDDFETALKVEDITAPVALTCDERENVARAIYKLLGGLKAEQRELLRLHHWGDFNNARHLSRVRQIIEKARERGLSVRLNYRFSPAQLAYLQQRPEKDVYRDLERGYIMFDQILIEAGYIAEKPEYDLTDLPNITHLQMAQAVERVLGYATVQPKIKVGD